MTFSEFNDAVQQAVFPDGSAENLVANHKNYVLDALIDLQIKVPCLQASHTDYLCASAGFFHCGASVFESPRGFIRSLSTLVPGDTCCQEVRYSPISKAEMNCLLETQSQTPCCGTETHPSHTYMVDGEYIAYPELPLYCFEYPNESDKTFRASEGFFTIDRGQIWVSPSIQGNELIKLEWDGIKREFDDADVLDEEIFNREVQECVELYLRGKSAAIDDCDYTRAILFNNENMQRPGQYQMRRADLIHTCEKQARPPKREYCFDTRYC